MGHKPAITDAHAHDSWTATKQQKTAAQSGSGCWGKLRRQSGHDAMQAGPKKQADPAKL